jgi:SAM-dependent methyltransferase
MTLPPLTPAARLRWDAIEPYLDDLPNDPRILELGAGSGAAAARLALLGNYVGVEPDPASNEVARSRLPNNARMLGSLEDLEEEDFDLLCSFEVLEHIADDHGELQRWLTHVKPGGMVLVSVPAHRHRFGAADEGVGHLRRYDPADLVELLVSAGLVDVKVVAYGFPLGYLLEWVRNRLAVRDARRASSGAPADIADRTADSGRLRQPPVWASPMIDIATWPFRILQRAAPAQDLGPGLIGRGRVPS